MLPVSCMWWCVCVCVSTEGLTRWVCFPSVLVNRSRAAFMCRAHYHGDGFDGNTAAVQVWQATVYCHKPHVSTSSSSPQYMLFILRTQIFHTDAVCSQQNTCGSGSGLTCPHSSSPTPMKTHHSHWSMVRAVQENGFPPNWTMTIWGGKETQDMSDTEWTGATVLKD